MSARALAIGLGVLVAQPALATECESPTSARDLSDASGRFYAAWHELDEEGVSKALAEATTAVECVDEPLTPPDVVTYFQITGLAAFLEDDTTRARDAFRAAIGVLPTYGLPTTVASPGDDWYEMYEALRSIPDDGRKEMPAPAHGWLHADGARAGERPTARPWLFQQFDGQGKVVQTAVVWTGADTPAYVEVEAPPKGTAVAPIGPVVETHPSRTLAIAGGACVVAGLGGLAGAAITKSQFKAKPTLDDAEGLIVPNIMMGSLGWAATVTGTGLVGGAVVMGKW